MKKLKNREVLGIYYALPSLGNLKGVKFNYGVDKNRKRLQKEVESIEASNKPSLEFEVYDKERIKINEKFAQKNADGTPKMTYNQIGNNQQISKYIIDTTRTAEFDKEHADLKEKHKKIVEEREKQLKEYRDLLEQENEFIPFFIELSSIPEDINGSQFELVSVFLKEEEEKKEEIKKE